MKNHYLLLFFLLCCFSCKKEKEEPIALTAEGMYMELISSLDPLHPGKGKDVFDEESQNRPMAYGLIMNAEANRYLHTENLDALERVRTCGNWLIDNSDINQNGLLGYGIPDAWDAFDDGTPNPAHAEYMITTAICIDGLVDWLSIEPVESTRNLIQSNIESLFAECLNGDYHSPLGIPSYSYLAQDQVRDVYNPALYLAIPLTKFSDYTGNFEFADQASEIAEKCLLASRVSPEGFRFFNYSSGASRPNDLKHYIYCFEGLRAANSYQKLSIPLELFAEHVNDFRSKNMWYEYTNVDLHTGELNCRLWALSMLLYRFGLDQENELIEKQLLPQIALYYQGDGKYKFKTTDERNLIRQNAHLLHGLSHYIYR